MGERRRILDALVIALAVTVDLITWDGERWLRDSSWAPAGGVPFLLVPVVVGTLHLSLWWRRSHPVAVFGVQWAFALAASLVMPQFQPFAGLLVALHAVASMRAAGPAAAAYGVLIVPFAVHSYNSAAHETASPSPVDVIGLLCLWLGLAAAAWGAGRLSFRSARRAWRQRELQAAAAAAAQAEDRRRLARELHDSVAGSVTAMLLQAAGGRAQLDHDLQRVRRALGAIEDAGAQAMTELHRMLDLLDDSPDRAPPSAPTVADITELVLLAREAGRRVRLVQTGIALPLTPDAEVTAYRIVQEALTNSMKYAGEQAEVQVRLGWTAYGLTVEVLDQSPPGSPVPIAVSGGRGLTSLRERTQLAGGTFTAQPAGSGFAVRGQLPVR